ncbi:unnamed protein product, partial [Adineta ricciae]
MSYYNRGQRGRNNNYSNNNQRPVDLNEEEFRLVNQGRDELFEKKKTFSIITSLKNCSLLLRENLFQGDRWEIEELMQLKRRLNDTRNRLNEKDIKVWKQHTGKTNMTGKIVWSLRDQNRIEMCTNAWIKMAEIFSQYRTLIPRDLSEHEPFRSVHVCEAPGAFICATNFYFNKICEERDSRSSRRRWEWTGLSLNPYYEGNDQEAMVDDDRFIVETLNRWYFGVDNSGNILNQNNINGLWNKINNESNAMGVHLVTGDGSVDTSGDPNEQESIVSELHYTEAICALGVLAKGGSVVLKMFSLFECDTVCLLYILALHFKELNIFKPASSRAPNGETYAIAIGFRGINNEVLQSLLSFVSSTFPSGKALIPRQSIPQSFIDELIKFAEYFTMKQIQALERNLDLEKIWNRNVDQAVYRLNMDVAKEFRRQCSIDFHYKQRVRIVNDVYLDGSAKSLGNSASLVKGGLKQREGGTLADRQDKKRSREEFISDSNRTETDTLNKRRALDQGKTVAIGSAGCATRTADSGNETSEMDTASSNNEQQQSVAMKMMKKMGHIEGQGLGAHSQGRSAPIETLVLNSRLGLGHHNQPSVSSSSSSSSTVPKVKDEPLFSEYDQPISNRSFHLSLDQSSVTVASGLRSVLSSLYVKFSDLELLYKKREECQKKIREQHSSKRGIFIAAQLELLNKEEKYRTIHGIFVHYQTAFQLATLDKLFKLTSSLHLNNSTPLAFFIDNVSFTGFAEYLLWQQRENVQGFIISNLKNNCPINPYVQYRSSIESIHSKFHLFFSDLSILPMDQKINRRYLEQYNKRQMLIACRNALTNIHENG